MSYSELEVPPRGPNTRALRLETEHHVYGNVEKIHR
jgi:hypothetical protein